MLQMHRKAEQFPVIMGIVPQKAHSITERNRPEENGMRLMIRDICEWLLRGRRVC